MICGIFHEGSGLGNQLHRYVGARVAALDRGEEFGMVAPDLFKGKSFLNIDMGKAITDYHIEQPSGKVIPHDTNLTILDQEFQNEKVWKHREKEVREWLKVEPLDMTNNTCVISFRGGEYKYFPELYLPQSYWQAAIGVIDPLDELQFIVVTDDPIEARRFFPSYPITHEISMDWRMIRYARNLILSNSSFAILPALLGEAINIVAPKYWARRNQGYWLNPDNEYQRFTYI